jgi:hypothetical protein
VIDIGMDERAGAIDAYDVVAAAQQFAKTGVAMQGGYIGKGGA